MKMSDTLVIVPAQPTDAMVAAGFGWRQVDMPDNIAPASEAAILHAGYQLMVQAFDPITWEVARAQVIRELVEKVPEGLWGFSTSEQRTVTEWLAEQMEG
jgi:hypothetical protein